MVPVIAHFNLITGNDLKEMCMREKGYWRYDFESNTCGSDETVAVDYTDPAGCKIKQT